MALTMDTLLGEAIGNTRRAGLLKRFGIHTVADALTYFPFRVTPPVPRGTLRQAKEKESIAVRARVIDGRDLPFHGRRGSRLVFRVSDAGLDGATGGSTAELVFFTAKQNYTKWMLARLAAGQEIVLSGAPGYYDGVLQFTHPEVLRIPQDVPTADEAFARVTRPRPVYHASARLSSEKIHETILALLARIRQLDPATTTTSPISESGQGDTQGDTAPQGTALTGEGRQGGLGDTAESITGRGSHAVDDAGTRIVPTVLPEDIRKKHGLMGRFEAFQAIHDPQSVDAFDTALRTFRYEEAYVSQLALLQARASAGQKEAFACPEPVLERLEEPTAVSGELSNHLSEKDGRSSQSRTMAKSGPVTSKTVDTRSQAVRPSLVRRLLTSLPFDLTPGQRQVCRQIGADMAQSHPMQRLLQGEVGSGKTIVALLAMLQAADAGHQAVLVAPTQVLAEQHYDNIRSRLAKLAGGDGPTGDRGGSESPDDHDPDPASGHDTADGMADDPSVPPVLLLTGALRLAQRRTVLATVASGAPCLIVATHAAFSSSFQAPNLALVIIDEQHRFGVDQRDALLEKSEKTPHLLVMTATPIPRTAAMTWFGDLSLSELKGLPSGRKPVSTYIIDEDSPRMADVFGHLGWRIRQFHERAYVVCPAIETPADTDQTGPGGTEAAGRGSTGSGAHGAHGGRARTSGTNGRGARTGAAVSLAVAGLPQVDENVDLFTATGEDEDDEEPLVLHSVQEIAGILPTLPQLKGIPVATLTGRDDARTKERVMADFQSGKTPILVATTVIEVGVDVPQASSIVIFDADHFGLSQLHQLRGRVGRGGTPGWAFLISRAPADSVAAERLKVIASTHDGERIAEADLDLRGAGDVLGDSQAGGRSSFKVLRVVKDARLIALARTDAEATLAADPGLSRSPQLAGAVLDFRRGNEDYLIKN